MILAGCTRCSPLHAWDSGNEDGGARVAAGRLGGRGMGERKSVTPFQPHRAGAGAARTSLAHSSLISLFTSLLTHRLVLLCIHDTVSSLGSARGCPGST